MRAQHDAHTFSSIFHLPGESGNAAFIRYIGKFLPSAVFGMLVIYCLKNVSFLSGNHGLPELLAIAVTTGLHLWKRQMLFSISGGTICYMLLLRFVF